MEENSTASILEADFTDFAKMEQFREECVSAFISYLDGFVVCHFDRTLPFSWAERFSAGLDGYETVNDALKHLALKVRGRGPKVIFGTLGEPRAVDWVTQIVKDGVCIRFTQMFDPIICKKVSRFDILVAGIK